MRSVTFRSCRSSSRCFCSSTTCHAARQSEPHQPHQPITQISQIASSSHPHWGEVESSQGTIHANARAPCPLSLSRAHTLKQTSTQATASDRLRPPPCSLPDCGSPVWSRRAHCARSGPAPLRPTVPRLRLHHNIAQRPLGSVISGLEQPQTRKNTWLICRRSSRLLRRRCQHSALNADSRTAGGHSSLKIHS